MVIFAALLGGVYSAYKYFSGVDPLKLNPQALIANKIPLSYLSYLGYLGVKPSQNSPAPIQQKPVNFSFVIVSDSHGENSYLEKALSQAKEKGDLKFIIGLGDYTEVGTIEQLKQAKQILDASSLRYFLAPGDHDLWDARDKGQNADSNFIDVFGPTYQSFTYNNIRFLILNNADNYTGMSDAQMKWLGVQLEQAKTEGNIAVYAFMHEPLYHPSSDHVMGAVNKDLKLQAKSLIHTLKDGGVKMIFFGHNHFFSEYSEPDSNLSMVAIGALTTQNNAQAPRYAIVNVNQDNSLGVEDVQVK